MAKKILIILALAMSFCFQAFVFAETIVLKSGKSVEGKLIEKTDKYIKIDFMGVPLTYFFDEIESIDGKQSTKAKEESAIRAELKKLGYPENSWPSIEKELNILFKKIDFEHFKNEVVLVKNDPFKLGNILIDLAELLEQEGCFDPNHPHPLAKLLVVSLCGEDIFLAIDNSSIASEKKEEVKYELIACTAVSQLGYVMLDSLGFEAKVAHLDDLLVGFREIKVNGKALSALGNIAHVFNCVYLNSREVLFVDFINRVIKAVKLEEYYSLVCRNSWVLKQEYRISPERLLKVMENVSKGLSQTIKTEEILNMYYYFQILESSSGATASIYSNLGTSYLDFGDIDQAIYYFNKAIQIDPNFAQAYYNRGTFYDNQGNSSQAISDFTKAIEINPRSANVYYNRGVLYYKQGNSSQAISDFTKAIEINPRSANAYYNRGIAYSERGNFEQAISDYTKAMEIQPNFMEAYNNRGAAYLMMKDYDKAWADVHKAEGLGYPVNSRFLNDLKEESGRDR